MKYFSFLLCLLAAIFAKAQEKTDFPASEANRFAPKVFNFTSLSESAPVADLEKVIANTDAAYREHPEFGTVPYRTQCEDCYEILDRRTVDSRYFVKNGTDGSTFYVQQIYGQLHYQDQDGWLRTIDERLHESEQTGIYTAPWQPIPTSFNLNSGYASIEVSGVTLAYNGKTRLLLDDGTTLIDRGLPDLNQTSIGDDGVLSRQAWDNIDREQIFRQGEIKTNFKVRKDLQLAASTQWVIFEDEFLLPPGFSLSRDINKGSVTAEGYWLGDLIIANDQGQEAFRMRRPVITDANPDKYGRMSLVNDPSATVIAYEELVQGNRVRLRLRVAADWLSHPGRVFPITIDPLVSGSNTFNAGLMGFRYDASCWNATNFCGYNMTVNVPGQSTITNALLDAQYISEVWGCGLFVDCWMSEASFRVVGPCGNSPASPLYWTCLSPGGDNPGTCSGVGNPAAGTVTCIAPQCPNYSLSFQMRNYYCFCSSTGCVTACQYMPNNSWTMTVEARTIEATAEANSTPVSFTGSCGVPTSIDANPTFGVPGYTYNWNTGPSPNSQTQSVIHNSNGTYSYNVTVTDACGQTSVTAVNIVINDCPLPIEFEYFSGKAQAKNNLLQWMVTADQELSSFRIERSEDGTQFVEIGKVQANRAKDGYEFQDENPPATFAWYRLKTSDVNGESTYSEWVVIDRQAKGHLAITYRAESSQAEISWLSHSNGPALIQLYALDGKIMKEISVNESSGSHTQAQMDLNGLAKGMYLIKVNGMSRRFIIE